MVRSELLAILAPLAILAALWESLTACPSVTQR